MTKSIKPKYSVFKIILISSIFLTFLSTLRVTFLHYDMKDSIIEDTKKEARVLKDYFISMRSAYQEQFLQEGVEIDENSLHFLPAHVSSKISEKFKAKNKEGLYINSVSDNPRNPQNKADKYEMQAIEYFKNNTLVTEYFSSYKENGEILYQYAVPIYIQAHCLSCHGDRDKVLPIIAKLYDKAYGYKEGDLRGVVSVKIPERNTFEKLYTFMLKEILFSLISIGLVLFILYKTTKKEIQKIDEEALEYALTDGLTGLFNRHYLNSYIENFRHSNNEGRCFAVAFIDIDDFKKINDTYGHLVGDIIIKELALVLKSLTRAQDVLCRYGGEEFIIIISDIPQELAIQRVQEIRKVVANKIFDCEKERVSISIGVCFGGINDDINEVIENSDKALYMAKEAGKNCVKVFVS